MIIISLFSGYISYIVQANYPFFTLFNLTQEKYILLLILLSPIIISADIKDLRNWLTIGVLIVLMEAAAYTFIVNGAFLTSGNFGTNTLSTTLSMVILWLVSTSKKFSMKMLIVGAVMVLIISLLTGTRTTLLALLLGYSCYFFTYTRMSVKIIFTIILVGTACYLLVRFGSVIGSTIDFIVQSFNAYEVALRTVDINPESSSLMTRLSMWYSGWHLIQDYLFGVGYTGWHFLMSEYGVSIPIFIDPHNDFLFSIINYGIIGCCLYFYLIYLVPIKNYISSKNTQMLIPTIFVIASNLTNSNLYKHQFFTLYFTFLIIYSLRQFKNNDSD